MYSELAGTGFEDQPTVAGIDKREFEDISKEGAGFGRVIGIDESVCGGDHRATVDLNAPTSSM
jgi:hypothetical protein